MVLKVAITSAQEPLGRVRLLAGNRGRMGFSRAPYAVRSGPCRTKRNGRWLHCLDERTKCEPLCQFCVSWHTLSWSVPAEIAEMAETGSQTKTWIYADFIGLSREKDWCCQTGLNCRPLHYQWSALPLSYGSMPGSGESALRAPTGGRFLPQGPLWRKHAAGPGMPQNGQKMARAAHGGGDPVPCRRYRRP